MSTHQEKGACAVALREEIRRAGVISRVFREEAPAWGFLLLLGTLLFLTVVPMLQPLPRMLLAAVGLAGGLGAAMLALPLSTCYRRLRRAQLRRMLSGIPRAERAAVLLPLRAERLPDTRQLVGPLIRDLLPNGGELSPAPPPLGTGSEPAAGA